MSQNLQQNCSICNQKVENFVTLVSHSLYGKYSSSQNFYYTKQVNEILQQAISPVYIQFLDNNYYDDDQQYLKRQYRENQYSKKIQMLSQYYKFHRDLPTWNDRHVAGIMGKYYGRVKDVDYKKIKSILKKEQGISLTTQKSFSSMDDSQYTKKSRYSTMLNDLQHSNDSVFFKDLCQKIGKAFKKVKVQNNFKGSYYSGQKKFQQFLKKQNKRLQNIKKQHHKMSQNYNLNFKKFKFNRKMNTNTKDDQITDLKQNIYPSTYSMKDRKYSAIKKTISVQKTTANETISRQQKTKRQKSKNAPPSSSRNSISRKRISQNLIEPPIKSHAQKNSTKTYNIATIINQINSQNLKSVNEIYRPYSAKNDKTERQRKQKITIQLNRKNSSKQLIGKLKLRSLSQHNLPVTSTLNRDISKKKLTNTLKSNRSTSQKRLPVKGSVIQLDIHTNNQNHEVQTARQVGHKILRSSSSGKLIGNNEKQYTTNKIVGEKNYKKKGVDLQQILQRKLNIFKKKPIIL